MRFFFAFLFTQKRSHVLIMNDVTTGDMVQLLSFMAQLIRCVPLPGFDLCGRFPGSLFTQFILSLEGNVGQRRIKLRCKNGSNQAYNSLASLLPKLPNLTEIKVDRHPFFNFWKAVSEHPCIQTCNVPEDDLTTLGFTMQRLNPDMQEVFIVNAKP